MRAYQKFIKQFNKQNAKQYVKQILRHPNTLYCLAYFVAAWIWFVHLTCRTYYENEAHIQPFWDDKKPVIAITWHGRTLLAPFCWRSKTPYTTLASRHSDGEATALFFKTFGVQSIRGAGTGKASRKSYKNKGGVTAFRSMLKALRADTSIWLTADMPPGPAKDCDISIITLARQSGAPIVPMAMRSTHCVTLTKTWDKFLLPLPLGRIAYIWGAPVYVRKESTEEDMEAIRQTLQNDLNRLSARANRIVARIKHKKKQEQERG